MTSYGQSAADLKAIDPLTVRGTRLTKGVTVTSG